MLKAAFEESVRSLTQQATVLESVRTRAGLLITAANVVTALLAVPAIRDRPGLGLGGLAAIAFFLVSFVCAIWVLWPRSHWQFAFDATKLTVKIKAAEWPNLAEFHERLADRNETWWRSNAEHLDGLFRAFQLGAALLVLEVVAWMLVLAKVQVDGVEL